LPWWIVDIQDGHALAALVERSLGGHGGVVDEAIAAEEIGAGMMAGRARQQ
jgi:hypothetical protein